MNMHSPADLFRWACRLDVATRKAGNVSWVSPGHGMKADTFVASGDAAAGPLCTVGASVGERIEAAVRASVAVAGCNTNLGIVLLCAPLIAAAQRLGDAPHGVAEMRAALEQVILQLDVADARAAYRAIVLANPGGLGAAAEQDVHAAPTVTLHTGMALAAHRDLIASQYAKGFPEVFGLGLTAFLAPSSAFAQRHWTPNTGMLHCYLALLASQPDSHIVRKQGEAMAHCVMAEARPWLAALQQGSALESDPAYAAWDATLKARGINPGTTADLSVASALLAALCDERVHMKALRGTP